jgi:glutamate dehydrogenase
MWAEIDALDSKVHAATQTRMILTVHAALIDAMKRILANKSMTAHLASSIDANRKGLAQLGDWLMHHSASLDTQFTHTINVWCEQGVPEALARRVAHFPTLVSAFDLVALSAKTKTPIGNLAAIFFTVGKRLHIGWLGRLASGSKPWQREAAQTALDELASHHRRLTAMLAAKRAKAGKEDVVDAWVQQNAALLESYDAMLAAGHAAGAVDLAMLLLANQRLGALFV